MLVTQSEYARQRGVSRQAVAKAIKRGVVRVDADGMVDTDQANMDWPPRLNMPLVEAAAPQPAPNTPPRGRRGAAAQRSAASEAMVASRSLREAYSARLVRLEYEEKSGKLVDREQARTAAFNTGRRTRDLLAAMPDRLAAALAMRPTEEVHKALVDEVQRLCEEVTRWASL